MAINYGQLFCSVADLVAEGQAPGDEAGLFQRVREASDYLQKELGWFIPVTLTRTLKAARYGSRKLFVPPLLWITSIVNDTTTLVATDYLLQPEAGFWAHGPYTRLVVEPDAANLGSWSDRDDGVVIAGGWGLYNRSKSTGAQVKDSPKQTDSQLTLSTDNGALVSPGMVLLIESEQELVTGWGTPVDSTADLAAAASAGDEELTLTNASLVSVGEILRVDFEQMKVLDRNTSTNKVYVRRRWNGTQAVAHLINAGVDVYRQVTVERGMNGTTAAEHLLNAAISRYVAPEDVQFLTKEIATLMGEKAGSQYQGRTGKEDGVIFYHDAFPRFDIDRLKTLYSIRSFT